ncbi:hypothetical protein KGQ20_04195 [Catenulispora sp. NF23]|uniref:Uncharacterized protein n=1 Tax=Catenulispora pinistramenti TaxID=2705254 RepID=A0ABS5KIW9_9ACTN|nr:hypothetical protein [Catenulispora pinistramenti]MBS2531965.1 hypothetical protein [Catenulispora pinistramenti]MBS2546233.1 hypothetical protein [Catenulispora pinistramenti]
MKYEITVEDLVPRRRELTIEIPEDLGDTNDLSEYLDQHPELWRDIHLPTDRQIVTVISPAPEPEPLANDHLIAVEWDETAATHYRALVTIGELLQELGAAGRKTKAFHDPVEMSWHLRGYAPENGLGTWLNLLHAQRRVNTTSTTPLDDPLITNVRLATNTERDEHRATIPTVPGLRDSTVTFEFAETFRGRVDLTDLAEAGVWQPGTPVTSQVLKDYFGPGGQDRGQVTDTEHDHSRINYTGPEDGDRR